MLIASIWNGNSGLMMVLDEKSEDLFTIPPEGEIKLWPIHPIFGETFHSKYHRHGGATGKANMIRCLRTINLQHFLAIHSIFFDISVWTKVIAKPTTRPSDRPESSECHP